MLDFALLEIHRPLDSASVLRVACDELVRFGSFASAFLCRDNQLAHVHTSMSVAVLEQYLAQFGGTQVELSIETKSLSDVWAALQRGEAILVPDLMSRIIALTPSRLRPVAEWMNWRSGNGSVVLAPLTDNNITTGAIAILGGRLRESDLPAIRYFAQHISLALENARKFEEAEAHSKHA